MLLRRLPLREEIKMNTEIAELMHEPGHVYEMAEKTKYKRNLSAEEKDAAGVLDAWAKEIGKTGYDEGHEIAAFVTRTVNDELYNAPDELLDSIFDRGTVGEFDDYETQKEVKNTLLAYEAAKGGNVDRSYLDFSAIAPQWVNLQVESDISYVDMRKNGWKSIATLTTYAKEALQNKMFARVFGAVDAAITGGEQKIDVAGAAPTQEAMDALALYLTDRDPSGAMAVCLTKYAQQIGRITGYHQYMSDAMKDEFNRYGLVNLYDGVRIAGVSSAKKDGKGDLLFPDKRIFGLAGKIGTLDMKGEIHTFEDMDNSHERVHLMVKDFTFGYAVTHISKVAKIVFSS